MVAVTLVGFTAERQPLRRAYQANTVWHRVFRVFLLSYVLVERVETSRSSSAAGSVTSSPTLAQTSALLSSFRCASLFDDYVGIRQGCAYFARRPHQRRRRQLENGL